MSLEPIDIDQDAAQLRQPNADHEQAVQSDAHARPEPAKGVLDGQQVGAV